MRGAASSVSRDLQTLPLSAITYTPPSKCLQHWTVQQSSIEKWDIFFENGYFAHVGGPRRNIVITFGVEKLEWCCYTLVKNMKTCLLVSTEYSNVTDKQADTAWRHRPKTVVHDDLVIFAACGVHLSVCLSTAFMYSVETNSFIFSPSVSHTILVFPYQTSWQYTDGNPSDGGVDCRWGRKKSRFSTSIWLSDRWLP